MNKVILTRLALLGVGVLSAPWALGQEASTQERINETKQAVSDYVFLRQQIAETRNEWRVYREVTQRRIDFFREEIDRLADEIAEAEENRSAAQDVIEERRQEISRLERANAAVNDAMPGIESQVEALGQYFPEPLKNRVSQLMDQLGSPRQAAQRMAIVIGIMNEVDKFNSDWTNSSEQVGNSLVNTLYMGLAGGFYANAEGSVGGYLLPAEGAWERVEDNSIAPAVARAIRYYENEVKPAELVPLPLEVQDISFGE